MKARRFRYLIMFVVLLSMTVLAAPARGSEWYSFHLSAYGFGISVGSSDWWIHTRAWTDPYQPGGYESVLTGYGEWVYVHGIGRAWRPHVAVGWRPYTHGRWVHASIGWTWIAYEPWGYFPHHYGTWAHTHLGWVWTPGYTYHPANVVWVHWGGYVGWYPCGPAGWSHAARGYRHGYNNGLSHGYDHGYRDGWHDAQHATFVRWNRLSSHDVSRHSTSAAAVRRMEPADRMHAGSMPPTRSQMRRRGAEMVPEVELSRRTAQIGDRTVTIARPEGMAQSVRQNARSTVERARAPAIAGREDSARTVDTGTSRRTATAPANRANGAVDRTRRTDSIANRDGRPSSDSRRSRPAPAETTTAPSKPAVRLPEARTTTTRANTRAEPSERRGTTTRPSQNARGKPADARRPTTGDPNGDNAKPKVRQR